MNPPPEKNLDFIEVIPGVKIYRAAWEEKSRTILHTNALSALAELHRNFNVERLRLLNLRRERQASYDQGGVPEYLDRNSAVASGDWKIAPIPTDLLCRRVEITGPVNSAKMVINMLSRTAEGARADCAMLDFEDSCKPSWFNVISGFHNLIGAVNGSLTHLEPASKGKPEKLYRVDKHDCPIIMARCRGLHLTESNLLIDGKPISAGLFDLALCFLHTAEEYLKRGLTPKYYIPKCEHYLEARWWNNLFNALEDKQNLPRGTLRATFLIETLPAAYQIEEILFETKEHTVGLNVGRWDKIFSDIKTLKLHSDRILADRGFIDMQKPWMKNYALRLIEICHRRGAFAMGGMSAFTPGKTSELREQQLAKVKEDKANEAALGHDGCWVSHPFFIAPAMAEFKDKNQLSKLTNLPDKYPDILPEAIGPKTEAGLRKNIRVGIAYLQGWLNDIGCVSWDNLMEDLATLEISRVQVWQWLHHSTVLDSGAKVTKDFVRELFAEELDRIISEVQQPESLIKQFQQASKAAENLFTKDDFQEFLSTESELA